MYFVVKHKHVNNNELQRFFCSTFLLCIIPFASLLGCTHLYSKTSDISIRYSDRETLNFTGRGSSAGTMLDSVIVGGAAIGIAIDQGIANDISRNILQHNPSFDFRRLVQQSLAKSSAPGLESITIKTYGFKTAPGDDQVSAWVVLDVVKNGKNIQVNYPEDFSDVKTENFMKVTEDAAIAITLLHIALDEVSKQPVLH